MAAIKRSNGKPTPNTLLVDELCWDVRGKALYIGTGTGSSRATDVELIAGSGGFDSLKGTAQTIDGDKQFTGAVDFASAKLVKVKTVKTEDDSDAPASTKFVRTLLGALALPSLYLADVAAFVSGLVGGGYVWARPRQTYSVPAPLAIGSSATFCGDGASFVAGLGLEHLFKLSGWNPYLKEVYVADNRSATGAAVEISGQRLASVQDLTVINAGPGAILLRDIDGTAVARANLNDIHAEEIAGIGLEMRSTVFDTQVTNIYLSGLVDYIAGYGKPRSAVVGWSQITPRAGAMPTGGGHQVTNGVAINCGTGWHFQDAQLSGFFNCWGDSCSGYSLNIDGECWSLDFVGFYAGSSRGIRVAGTSTKIRFTGLETEFIGTIPPWGAANFFDAPPPYYDVTVEDTATCTIEGDSWRGEKRVSVGPNATLVVTGGEWLTGRNIADVPTATLVFLAELGQAAGEGDAGFRMPYTGYLFQMRFNANDRAGPGESFTVTARVDGANTALSATINDADYLAHSWGPVAVQKDHFISFGLSTSAGAAVTGRRFNVAVQILPP